MMLGFEVKAGHRLAIKDAARRSLRDAPTLRLPTHDVLSVVLLDQRGGDEALASI